MTFVKEVQNSKAPVPKTPTPSGTVTLFKEVQPEKAPSLMNRPIFPSSILMVIFSGNSMCSKEVQPEKDLAPMVSMLSPKVTLFMEVHILKAQFPISATLSGMTMLSREEHSLNAHSPIYVRLWGY